MTDYRDGTVRAATVPLGYGRRLRIARVDIEGEEPGLLVNVGFEDDPHPLVGARALVLPLEVVPALREALAELREVGE